MLRQTRQGKLLLMCDDNVGTGLLPLIPLLKVPPYFITDSIWKAGPEVAIQAFRELLKPKEIGLILDKVCAIGAHVVDLSTEGDEFEFQYEWEMPNVEGSLIEEKYIQMLNITLLNFAVTRTWKWSSSRHANWWSRLHA
jgi:hypothetical protein